MIHHATNERRQHMHQPRTFRFIVLAAFIIFGITLGLPHLAGFPLTPDAADAAHSQAAEMTAAERGLWNLQHKSYGMPLMNKQLLQLVANKAWEPEWKAKIDPNDPDSVRKVAFERYGFSEATW